MKLVDIIVGTRPNFVKVAALIKAYKTSKLVPSSFKLRLVHTGQHYHDAMSNSFFSQLSLITPDINLKVGSGTHAKQTAEIMRRYDDLLSQKKSHLCVVVGDVNSTVACAITAKKLNIPVAHIEAGIRSGDDTMPEEINRIVTDSISDFLFTTSKNANDNLIKEGKNKKKIFFVGNTMIDTLLANVNRLVIPEVTKNKLLKPKNYFVLTLHRPNNVDNNRQFIKLLQVLGELTRHWPIVFPIHPRIKKDLIDRSALPINFIFIDPQPYLEFIYLIKNSFAVITDSGGLSEETTVLRVPCLTIRNTTERPETVTLGTNQLITVNPKNFPKYFNNLFQGKWQSGVTPPKWDGKSAERIMKQISKILKNC